MRKQVAILIAVVIVITIAAPITAAATQVAAPQISSPGAVVIDFETGTPLFERNARNQRVPASMIKMIAVYAVFDAIEEGLTTMDSRIRISPHVRELSTRAGWSNVPLRQGETYSVRELLEIVIVRSANGATAALGEGIFGSDEALVARMNEIAREHNIRATFADSFGISAENRISPLALAWLIRHLIMDHPQVLEFTSMRTVSFRGADPLLNTNHLLTRFAGADGLKTGFTNAAGFCLIGTAVRDGRRLITVTMGNTMETRFPDTEALLEWGFANVDRIVGPPNQNQPEPPINEPDPPISEPEPPIAQLPQEGLANPSAANLILDGLAMPLSAYLIGDSHYFKLRDIAYLLNSTTRQFEVTWDSASNAIRLTTGMRYTPDGSELSLAVAGQRPFRTTPSILYLDGVSHSFSAFLIDGNNFFRLRELSDLIGFEVQWIGETRTVIINTFPAFPNQTGANAAHEQETGSEQLENQWLSTQS